MDPEELRYTGASAAPDQPTMPRSEFAPLVDSLVDGLVVITCDGIMVRANSALCKLFGYEQHDLLGKNVAMLMTPENAPHHDRYISDYLESGEANVIGIGREVTGKHRDGTLQPLELAVSPAQINDQQMFVGFLRDITERKEVEAELRLNNKIMQEVNNALANVINEGMSTREVFDRALEDLLDVPGSEYGFIGEILHDEHVPYLKTHAITNIAWNRETRAFYRDNVRAGLEFRNLDSLFGVTIRSGQSVITNRPNADPRRGGLPKGHPSLAAYLGVPIYSEARLLGMAGVANRTDGPTAPLTWAQRLKRVFDIDISVCPLCGGRVRVIADVTNPDVIQTILAHLKQRAPPGAARRQTPFKGAQNDLFAAS